MRTPLGGLNCNEIPKMVIFVHSVTFFTKRRTAIHIFQWLSWLAILSIPDAKHIMTDFKTKNVTYIQCLSVCLPILFFHFIVISLTVSTSLDVFPLWAHYHLVAAKYRPVQQEHTFSDKLNPMLKIKIAISTIWSDWTWFNSSHQQQIPLRLYNRPRRGYLITPLQYNYFSLPQKIFYFQVLQPETPYKPFSY